MSEDPQPRMRFVRRLRAGGWHRVKLVSASAPMSSVRLALDLRTSASVLFDRRTDAARFAGYIFAPHAADVSVEIGFDPNPGDVTLSLRKVSWPERLWLARRARNWPSFRAAVKRALIPPDGPRFVPDLVGGADQVLDLAFLRWTTEREAANLGVIRARIEVGAERPVIDILTPVCDPHPEYLAAAIDSVMGQTAPNWRLHLADDASTRDDVRQLLRDRAARDARIRVTFREERGGISAATNTAFADGASPFVAMLDHDDALAPCAVELASGWLATRPGATLLYSDEDRIDAAGRRHGPEFKPDFSPELLLSLNYVNHLCVVRRAAVSAVGGWRSEFDGAQDHDLLLRLLAAQDVEVAHLPAILYHWRAIPGSVALDIGYKPWAAAAGTRAVEAHLRERGVAAAVRSVQPGISHVAYDLGPAPPMLSVIVPTRDQPALIETCLRSLAERTDHPRFEVLVIDNGSTDADTLAVLDRWRTDPAGLNLRILVDPQPFNYSALNNAAVRRAEGSVLCFLNDDTEAVTPDWLRLLAGHALRPGVGCVGPRLLYPSGHVQHAGILLGVGRDDPHAGVAGHAFLRAPSAGPPVHARLAATGDWSAVTGACLVVRRELFDAAGGFDETELAVAFNDIDLCLKVRDLGRRNVCVPAATLIHHESMSRGPEDTPEKLARFKREAAVMRRRYGSALLRDPYYNPNLSLAREIFSPSLDDDFSRRLAL